MTSQPTLAENLLGFLLESGLQVALILPIILGIQLLAGNRISPTTKHALWLIVLLRLSFPIFPESKFSLFNYTPNAPAIPIEQTGEESFPNSDSTLNRVSPSTIPFDDQVSPSPPVTSPSPSRVDETWIPVTNPIQEPTNFHVPIHHQPPPTPNTSRSHAPPGAPNPTSKWQPATIVFCLWALGFFGLIAKLTFNGLHYQTLIRAADPIQDRKLQAILSECAKTLSLSNPIQAVQSPHIASPAIFGFLRPKLLLPEGIQQQYTPSELKHIILHELAHIRRCDPIWNWWASFVQIVHWPNPLVWYAVARQRGDRELATDYLVLRTIQNNHSQAYGQTLIKALEGVSKTKSIPGLIGIGEDRRGLRRRFKMIGEYRPKRRYSIILLLAIVCPLLGSILTDPKPDAAVNSEPIEQQETTDSETSTPLPPPDTRIITVKVTEVESGMNLPNVAIGFTFQGWNHFEDLTLGGKTDASGTAQITIPVELEANHALTLVALPADPYVAQFRTFVTRFPELAAAPIPNQHQFNLSRGIEIGGRVAEYDGSPARNVGIALKAWSAVPPIPQATENNLDILYVSKHQGLKTDLNGQWSIAGAPRTLDYVWLTAKDRHGNEAHYDTAKFVESHRYHLTTPMDLGRLLKNKGQIRLPDRGHVNIQVRDRSDHPIAGAEVIEFTGLEKKRRSSARTDSQGQVRFNNRTPKELLYLIKHPKHAPLSIALAPRQDSYVHQVVMSPQHTLKGRVIDSDQRPIAGARVEISNRLDTERYTDDFVTTDRAGRFAFEKAPLDKTFYEISAPDFFPQVYEWSNQGDDVIGILSPEAGLHRKITGLVIDDVTSQPIKEFYHGLIPTWGDAFAVQWISDSNDGTFIIPPSPHWVSHMDFVEKTATHTIAVGAPGYGSVVSRRISKHERDSQITFRLKRLPGAQSLSQGTVLHQDGSPAANVPIVISADRPLSRSYISILPSGAFPQRRQGELQPTTQLTNEKGRLPRITLPPNLQTLTLLSRRASLTLTADDLERPRPHLQLRPHGSIKGTLMMNGTVLTNRIVYLASDRSQTPGAVAGGNTKTDSQGVFRFDYVPYGNYQLSLTHPEYPSRNSPSRNATRTYQKRVTVQAGAVTQVAYHLEGATLKGRLMSHPGTADVSWPRGYYTLRETRPTTLLRSRPLPSEYVRQKQYRIAQTEFLRWQETIQNRPRYYLNVAQAGYFHIDAIPPGDYSLDLQAVENQTHSDPRELKVVGMINRRLTIPEGTRVIDLGPITIPVKSVPPPRIQHGSETASDPASSEALQTKARNIRFQVLDQSTKSPIEAATVKVRESWGKDSSQKKAQEFSLVTDQAGNVTHPSVDLSAQQLQLQSWAPGYVVQERLLSPQDHNVPESMTIGLHRGRKLSGIVQDANGKPVRDVVVSLSFSHTREMSFLKSPITLPRTGKDGRWSYDGIPAFVDSIDLKFLHRSLAYQAASTPASLSQFRQPEDHRSLRIHSATIRKHTPVSQPLTVTLVPGGQIRGQVIDRDLTPIPNATVRILGSSEPPIRSNQWGWFHFLGAFASPVSLQVIAKDYAPRIVKVNPTSDLEPLSIALKPGKVIRIKVTDPSGEPLPKANLLMMNWQQSSHPLTEQGVTDAKGEFVWTSAPEDGVDFTFMSDGYSVHHEKGLTPRPTPYLVTLKPTLITTFHVTNENAAPIDQFAIYRGTPVSLPPQKSPEIVWNNHPSYGSGGSRILATPIDSEGSGVWPRRTSHIYRIEAFGYKPQITRIIEDQESPVELNITLEPDKGTRALLLTSDGQPVPNQHITLSPPSDEPHFLDAPIFPPNQESTSLKTNASGHFMIPPVPPNTSLTVAAFEGYKSLTLQPEQQTTVVTLEPWVQISGYLLSSGLPIKNQTLGFRVRGDSNADASQPVFGFHSTTDDKGTFQFENVPPGKIEIIELPKPGPPPKNPTVIFSLSAKPGSRLYLEINLDGE